ncbi:unnamed protein product, partial [Rotaria sp. Silwood1]
MASKNVVEKEVERGQRFSDIEEDPRRLLTRISGYEKKPIVALEKAVEPLGHVEHEILLPPARRFEVVAVVPQGPELTLIQLEEIESPVQLIDLGPQNIVSPTAT